MPRIAPALNATSSSTCVGSIQSHTFKLIHFVAELHDLFGRQCDLTFSFSEDYDIYIEYYLHSHFQFSESKVVVYSLFSFREYTGLTI